jgi:hypothetical protein
MEPSVSARQERQRTTRASAGGHDVFAPSDARWAVVLDGTGIDSANAGAAVGVIGLAGGYGKCATVSHEGTFRPNRAC